MNRDQMIKVALREHLGKLSMDTNARNALIENVYAEILGVLNRVKNERLGNKTQAIVMTPESSMSIDTVEGREGRVQVKDSGKARPPQAI